MTALLSIEAFASLTFGFFRDLCTIYVQVAHMCLRDPDGRVVEISPYAIQSSHSFFRAISARDRQVSIVREFICQPQKAVFRHKGRGW